MKIVERECDEKLKEEENEIDGGRRMQEFCLSLICAIEGVLKWWK
ncbi:hypothetical protein A2U01_0049412, partial [Trifolium medium]|nr:hypothetical protein [Trifolium medium]